MTEKRSYRRYSFQERTGYIIDSRLSRSNHNWLVLGHTASVRPWSDADMHIHTGSEECYVLLSGRLNFRVGDSVVRLRPKEILVVRPRVPHAILSGEGTSEHFGIRAPARQDKKVVKQGEVSSSEIPDLPVLDEQPRELVEEWGCGVCHALHSRQAPFEGLTLRVPVRLNDKVACDGGL